MPHKEMWFATWNCQVSKQPFQFCMQCTRTYVASSSVGLRVSLCSWRHRCVPGEDDERIALLQNLDEDVQREQRESRPDKCFKHSMCASLDPPFDKEGCLTPKE